jgi:hypothetical protein
VASENQKGMLLIPDISGFTEFVSEVEISHSEHIIAELLELLIESENLGLQLCEIEGDALFFYKLGDAPTIENVIEQAEKWITAFHNRLNLIKRDVYCNCGVCQNVDHLGLKVVGHYGEVGVYSVASKTKVIGKDVILVHRMLKNEMGKDNYLLLTDSFTAGNGSGGTSRNFAPYRESYPVFGEVAMSYLDMNSLLADLPSVPPCEPREELEGSLFEEVTVNAPFDKVVKTLTDIVGWPEWIHGLERVELDESLPLRPGHHHVCVFPDQNLSITINQIMRDDKEFTMVENIKPPPPLKKLMLVQHAEKMNGGVNIRHTFSYDRKFFSRRKFEKHGVPMLHGLARNSLDNLKMKLEG